MSGWGQGLSIVGMECKILNKIQDILADHLSFFILTVQDGLEILLQADRQSQADHNHSH